MSTRFNPSMPIAGGGRMRGTNGHGVLVRLQSARSLFRSSHLFLSRQRSDNFGRSFSLCSIPILCRIRASLQRPYPAAEDSCGVRLFSFCCRLNRLCHRQGVLTVIEQTAPHSDDGHACSHLRCKSFIRLYGRSSPFIARSRCRRRRQRPALSFRLTAGARTASVAPASPNLQTPGESIELPLDDCRGKEDGKKKAALRPAADEWVEVKTNSISVL